MDIIVITGGSNEVWGSSLSRTANPQAAASVVEHIGRADAKAVALKLVVTNVGNFETFWGAVRLTLREVWDTTTLSGLFKNVSHGLFNPLKHVSEANVGAFINVHLKSDTSKQRFPTPRSRTGAAIPLVIFTCKVLIQLDFADLTKVANGESLSHA